MKSRYLLKITGKNYDRFLRMVKSLKIRIYSLSYLKDCIHMEVDEEGYEKISRLKTTYEVQIIALKGKVKWQQIYKRYRIFLGMFLLGFILLLFLSNLIFDVEVVHTKEEIRTLLYNALEDEKLAPFHWKPSYQKKEKIKEKILKKYKDKIEWLEIEEFGTKYIVRVEERKIKTEEEKTTPRNLVAAKDAMILSISASKGEIVKKRFDYVKKGETIVSGVIHKNEEAKSKVRAEGCVYGEVWYTVSVLLPIYQQEEKIIGKGKKQWAIHFLNHTYSFTNQFYRIRKSFPLFKSISLPISFQLDTVEKVQLTTKRYNLETGSKEGIRKAKEKLKVKLSKNSEILSQKVLKKQQKGSKIYIEVFFKVKEEITSYESIANLDLSKENKKQEEMG